MAFLNSACISFTLNQVYSLVRVYHRAISCWFHKCLPFCLISACVPLIASKYPTWCRSTFEPCHIDLARDFKYHYVYLSKWTSFPIAPDNCFSSRPLRWERTITTRHWNLKVLFFPGHSIKSLDPKDRGLKSHINSAVRNRHIPQIEMDLSLKREVAGETGKIPLFNCLDIPFSLFNIEAFFIVCSCSLSFHKSRDEISF
jgi:hypothetical protein